MPSRTPPDDRVAAVNAVVDSYHRFERLLSGSVALAAGAVGGGLVLVLPLWQWALVVVGLVVSLRAPLVRPGGSFRLETEADPDMVRSAFAGPRPPVLAFQWGVADTVATTGDGVTYETAYLLGRRSVTLRVEFRDGPADVDRRLVVTRDGGPWGTYDITVSEHDGGTTVDVTVTGDRRFGLRRLPQRLLTARYRERVFDAQGYTLTERDVSLLS